MVNYRIVAFAGLAAALPLNINLGAYSPALVVGDGEISFGGRQDVAGLIGALEGAAVSAASGVASASAPAAEAPAAANVRPQAAPVNVEAAAVDPALAQQAQQIAALQGIAKEIAPREDETTKAKRDLAGFDRALRYAEAALTKGPDIQLGTGAEGSGVGIIVDNQPTAQREGGRAERRDVDESSTPRRRAKVTTMYVRRGVPAGESALHHDHSFHLTPWRGMSLSFPALQGSSEVPVPEVTLPVAEAPASRTRRDVLDEVNLNVDGNAGLTMTFVEEVDGDEE
ncbi:hypothetical protein B0T16DRAFT_338049 [Cercophora newfieldiana]|uniref:Uncharacterized protein n=1 Tax=Cercophora newfieldiana TaxID=92897 RepID=A0AA39XTA2_9PEZI|nr:hypothetical protein B0T16DRAFT_338049 [Cercophora newfieldiana]